MRKFDYYLHRSCGKVGDYFCEIGEPFKVSTIRYYLYKIFKYRCTKVPKGSNKLEVIEVSINNHFMHNNSHSANKLREAYSKQPLWV